MTGSTGFIGQALAKKLASGGHELTAFVRNRERAKAVLPAGARLHDFEELWGGPLADCDALVNLAGEPLMEGRWSADRKQKLVQSRVQLTERLVGSLAGLEQRRLQTIVSASAVGYYGDRGDEVLPETASPGTDFLSDLCVSWEKAASGAKTLGVRVVLARIGVVLSPHGGALQKLLPVFRAGVGGKIASGQQFMPWIHLEDLLSAFELALTQPAVEGPMNFTAPHPARNLEFTKALGRVVRRPTIFPVPAPALSIALGEAANVLLASQRVVPKALEAAGFRFRHPDLEPAFRDLLK